jgi:hypothetical protein
MTVKILPEFNPFVIGIWEYNMRIKSIRSPRIKEKQFNGSAPYFPTLIFIAMLHNEKVRLERTAKIIPLRSGVVLKGFIMNIIPARLAARAKNVNFVIFSFKNR